MPSTPGGILSNAMRADEVQIRKVTKTAWKLVEASGNQILTQVHKTDPWEARRCPRTDCNVCLHHTGEGNPRCKVKSIIYKNV